jgi:hypothetical protein
VYDACRNRVERNGHEVAPVVGERTGELDPRRVRLKGRAVIVPTLRKIWRWTIVCSTSTR